MKKKFFILLLTLLICLSVSTSASAFETSNKMDVNIAFIAALADSNSTITEGYKRYKPFSIKDYEIRLYPEPIMTADEALEVYKNAYKFCADEAKKIGITASIDNTDFIEFAKIYAAFNESGTKNFVKECRDFAVFLDYYEGIEKNKQILNAVSSNRNSLNDINIEFLMPITSHSTTASGEVVYEKKANSANVRSGAYNTSAVVEYAKYWWNKTNSTDYPYYAKYNGLSTSSLAYNDLDPGRSGQSNPRRNWNDCTNFVSQCLVAGGVPQIKTGLILPHQKKENWYYNNDRPSHTWGGAANFYEHWKDRVGVASSSSDLGVGDAVSVDISSDGDIDHTVIIISAGSTDSSKYLASHTYDRYMYYYLNDKLNKFNLSYLYENGCKIYGYEIDKAF